MKNKIKTIKILLSIFIVFVAGFFLLVSETNAEENKFIPELQVAIPGLKFTKNIDLQPGEMVNLPWIAQYIVAIYNFSTVVGGILATVMIIFAGFEWLIAGGNQSNISKAKERIVGAFIGLLLLFGSYVLLQQINPKLVDIKSMEIQVVGGTCGNMALNEEEVGEQCSDVSPSLALYFNCMSARISQDTKLGEGELPEIVRITEDMADYNDCRSKYNKNLCGNNANSCHYGGDPKNTCNDGSYAVDLTADDLSEVAEEFIVTASFACGADSISGPMGQTTYSESDHSWTDYKIGSKGDETGNAGQIHVSVGGKKCGCFDGETDIKEKQKKREDDIIQNAPTPKSGPM